MYKKNKKNKKNKIIKQKNKTIKNKTIKNKKLNTNKIGNDIDNHMIEIMIVISKNKNNFVKLFKKHLLQNRKINKREKITIEEIYKHNKNNIKYKSKKKK